MQDKPPAIRRTAGPILLVIDSHPLTGKHFAGLIRARYRNARVVVTAKLDEMPDCDPDLLIVNLNDRCTQDPEGIAQLEGARRRFPGVPLTVLCGRPRYGVFPPGVRAVFEPSLPADVLVAALRLVMAGEVYFHVDAAPPVPETAAPDQQFGCAADGPADLAAEHGLTAREQQVLHLLRRGRANKLIAHELCISENTVKVHVRRVMRKLNVTNRTQAAFVQAGEHERAF